MENVNKENKVVEYEIITTKKYRQVVKVQFDEKYSDELNETKITPSDIDFELGEEIDVDESFTTKVVDETPDKLKTLYKLMTFSNEGSISWGEVVPKGTKSVLTYNNFTWDGTNGECFKHIPITVYLNCPYRLVEELWNSSKIKELSSYFVGYDFPKSLEGQSCYKPLTSSYVIYQQFDDGFECLETIREEVGDGVYIGVYDVRFFQLTGRKDIPKHYSSHWRV
jgi:hypothetical protein